MTLRFLPLAAFCLSAVAAAPVLAHGPDAQPGAEEEKVVLLQQQALPEIRGKNVLMVTVDFAPGQASAPHVHPGSLFAYVLEGTVLSQLAGQPEMTYRAGDSWYEPPRAPHLVARNASTTKPARLLVWALADDGQPVKRPLPKQ